MIFYEQCRIADLIEELLGTCTATTLRYRMHARLYVDEETGVNLFEKHKNLAGKGVPKFFKSKKQGQVNLQKIFTNEIPPEYFSPNHIKEALIRECYLKEECHSCKFKERRVLDYKNRNGRSSKNI